MEEAVFGAGGGKNDLWICFGKRRFRMRISPDDQWWMIKDSVMKACGKWIPFTMFVKGRSPRTGGGGQGHISRLAGGGGLGDLG